MTFFFLVLEFCLICAPQGFGHRSYGGCWSRFSSASLLYRVVMPINTVLLTTSGLLGVYVYFVVDLKKHIIEMSFPVVAFLLCSLLGFRFRRFPCIICKDIIWMYSHPPFQTKIGINIVLLLGWADFYCFLKVIWIVCSLSHYSTGRFGCSYGI